MEAPNDRLGDFWGLSIMPMRWLVEDRLKFVSRPQLQSADAPEGIRLNSRYARSAAAKGDADLSLTGGRGDKHNNLYFGWLHARMKIVSGIEYDDIETTGGIFSSWTVSSAFRMYNPDLATTVRWPSIVNPHYVNSFLKPNTLDDLQSRLHWVLRICSLLLLWPRSLGRHHEGGLAAILSISRHRRYRLELMQLSEHSILSWPYCCS